MTYKKLVKLSLAAAGYPRARRQREGATVTNLFCVFGPGQLVPGCFHIWATLNHKDGVSVPGSSFRAHIVEWLEKEVLSVYYGWKNIVSAGLRCFSFIVNRCSWWKQSNHRAAELLRGFPLENPGLKSSFYFRNTLSWSVLAWALPQWGDTFVHDETEGHIMFDWLNLKAVFFLCLFHLKALCCPDNVSDSSQCRPTAARHRHPHALSLPPLITWPLPRRHHPPARLPLFAAGFPMAARRPPAARTHGAPFTESPFCSRLDSPGRRWPLTPVTSHCRLSESWSALSWIRRYHHTTTHPIKNTLVMLTFDVTFLILWNPKI